MIFVTDDGSDERTSEGVDELQSLPLVEDESHPNEDSLLTVRHGNWILQAGCRTVYTLRALTTMEQRTVKERDGFGQIETGDYSWP